MLQRSPHGPELSAPAQRVLWGLVLLDTMAVAWMLTAGEWLDRSSRVTAVITLGGRHELVLWLAALGLAVLLVVAVATGGFRVGGPTTRGFTALAAGASVVAVGGMVSVALLVVGAAVLVALLGWALVR